MKLVVREVDVDSSSNREELVTLLKRNLADLDHARRFDWLYTDNPAGPARCWFLCDDTERVVAAASLIPRLLWIGERVARCGQVGDFAVDRPFRALGPALRLQKATFGPVDAGELTLCYDCPPDERGMSTFRRLGIQPACRMARYVKPLRAGKHIRKRLPGGPAVRAPATVAVNFLLWCRDLKRKRTKGLELQPMDSPFGEEFSSLDDTLGNGQGTIRSRRSAEILNWRFRSDPLHRYQVITARRNGELLGYAVGHDTARTLKVVDISTSSDPIRLALLDELCHTARSAGKDSVNLLLADSSSDVATAFQAGFHHRALANFVVPYTQRTESHDMSNDSYNWSFTRADVMA